MAAKFFSAALICLALSGCGAAAGEDALFSPSLKTLIIVELRDTPLPGSMEGFAWCFFAHDNLSGQDPQAELLHSCDAHGRLLAVVEQEPARPPFGDRQHLFIGLDSSYRTVSVIPEDLYDEMPVQAPSPDSSGQDALLSLVRKYRPDVFFMSVNRPSDPGLEEVMGFWRERALADDLRFIAFSLPTRNSRGWCAMAWRDIETGYVPGLTHEGFWKTVAILAGITWDSSISTGVPAASVLRE